MLRGGGGQWGGGCREWGMNRVTECRREEGREWGGAQRHVRDCSGVDVICLSLRNSRVKR